jgi:hypothetical protein
MGRSIDDVTQEYVGPSSLKRMVDERDVAALALFLASDEGANISGETLKVAAGFSVEGFWSVATGRSYRCRLFGVRHKISTLGQSPSPSGLLRHAMRLTASSQQRNNWMIPDDSSLLFITFVGSIFRIRASTSRTHANQR